MRTPDQCRAKADDLEREASASKSALRRQAFLDLARHWRRLAGDQTSGQEGRGRMGWI